MAPRAILEIKVTKGRKANRVRLGPRVTPELKAIRVPKENPVHPHHLS